MQRLDANRLKKTKRRRRRRHRGTQGKAEVRFGNVFVAMRPRSIGLTGTYFAYGLFYKPMTSD